VLCWVCGEVKSWHRDCSLASRRGIDCAVREGAVTETGGVGVGLRLLIFSLPVALEEMFESGACRLAAILCSLVSQMSLRGYS